MRLQKPPAPLFTEPCVANVVVAPMIVKDDTGENGGNEPPTAHQSANRRTERSGNHVVVLVHRLVKAGTEVGMMRKGSTNSLQNCALLGGREERPE